MHKITALQQQEIIFISGGMDRHSIHSLDEHRRKEKFINAMQDFTNIIKVADHVKAVAFELGLNEQQTWLLKNYAAQYTKKTPDLIRLCRSIFIVATGAAVAVAAVMWHYQQ